MRFGLKSGKIHEICPKNVSFYRKSMRFPWDSQKIHEILEKSMRFCCSKSMIFHKIHEILFHKKMRYFLNKVHRSMCRAAHFMLNLLNPKKDLFCRIKLSYRILNEWYLTVLPSFPIKWRYTNIEPVLNSIPIKLHRVFLSHNVVTVSSHYLIFHQHMYARQLSNRSILHAGRYLNDKEICYLGTVIVTANVCRGRL